MNNHVINRQIIELELDSEKDAFRFQQHVRELYQAEILPMLDEMMSSLTSENEVLRIDRLELDLGVLNFEKFDKEVLKVLHSHMEEQLKKEIRKASENNFEKAVISRKMNGIVDLTPTGNQQELIGSEDFLNENKTVNAVLKSNDQSEMELLRIFFAEGLLPWWSADEFKTPDIDVLIMELSEKRPGAVLQLFAQAIRNPTSARRIIRQIEKQTLTQLLSLFPVSVIKEIRKIWSVMTNLEKENDSLQLHRADAVDIVFLTAVMIYGEYGGAMVGEEVFIEKLVKTSALVIQKEPLSIEKLLYNETLVMLLSVEKKDKVDTALISYFSDWEKRESAAAVSISGSNILQVSALLNPIELRNLKQYELLEKGIKEFLQKNNERDIRQSRKPFSQEKNDSEKVILSKKEFSEMDEQVPAELEEIPVLEKTPAAAMTRYGGLALLTPFLPAFFREMKLLKNDVFPGDTERYKAIHLLNFIATGKTKAVEYELVFHKLLCGLELTSSVPKTVKLSSAEKKEAMLFLDDIAEQWTALRTSSGEVLRNTFMRRNGIIEKKEDAWLLRIERGAVDIMLDTLPWTISIVRAPWMQQLLHIEW